MGKEKTSDFRYNTGDTKVPWAAVGENYNAADTFEFVKFLMQGKGAKYNAALKAAKKAIDALGKVSAPPGKLSMGDKVSEVEKAIDAYLGVEEGSSLFLTNCTAALEMGYRYAGIGPGDEVIVPTNTFIATVAYPLSVGAKLVFADVDPRTVNMDPADVARKITPKTKIIVPVHIGGYPVEMDPIMELAKQHDIVVMEDAAHGFGGEYKGRKLGTIGHFGCFSFHEVKNCTSFGEGGVFVSNVPEYRGEARRARFLGVDFTSKIKNWLYNISLIKGKGDVAYQASNNASVTEIQAIGLLQQLKRYDAILAERRRDADDRIPEQVARQETEAPRIACRVAHEHADARAPLEDALRDERLHGLARRHARNAELARKRRFLQCRRVHGLLDLRRKHLGRAGHADHRLLIAQPAEHFEGVSEDRFLHLKVRCGDHAPVRHAQDLMVLRDLQKRRVRHRLPEGNARLLIEHGF